MFSNIKINCIKFKIIALLMNMNQKNMQKMKNLLLIQSIIKYQIVKNKKYNKYKIMRIKYNYEMQIYKKMKV